MSIKLGNTGIGSLYLGSTKIAQAYLGSTKIYDSTTPVPTGGTPSDDGSPDSGDIELE